MQADILTAIILPASLFLIMYGLGLTLKPDHFHDILKAPKAVYVGLTGQLLCLPLMALAIADLFKFSPEIAVGLMIIALAPGGVTSNMFSYLSKGDVALSISLTVIISLITPFTIPLIVSLSIDYFMGAETQFSLPILETIIKLLVITIVPVALGMLTLRYKPGFSQKMETLIKWFSVLFMFIVIAAIVMKNSDNMLSFFAQAGLATLILNILALALGYYLAHWFKLSERQSVTIGFEVGIQNGSLALVVAGTIIGNETMMIPAVTYGLLMFITGAAFGWLLRLKVTT